MIIISLTLIIGIVDSDAFVYVDAYVGALSATVVALLLGGLMMHELLLLHCTLSIWALPTGLRCTFHIFTKSSVWFFKYIIAQLSCI